MSRSEAMSVFVGKHLDVPFTLHPLAGDASFRRYVRVAHAGGHMMLMDAPPEREDVRPFMTIANHLYQAGFSAPQLLGSDEAQGFLLLEDLGDDTFSRLLTQDAQQETAFYQAAVNTLIAMANAPHVDIPSYDHSLLLREVKLFSDWFLPQILDEALLADAQASYIAVWEELFKTIPLSQRYFIHRDYHADNLMWLPGRSGHARVGLLDFQDAVRGDAAYDLVSLLEDARRDVSVDLAQAMIAHYVKESAADAEQFTLAYALLAAQRNSKIIGIFTRLCARDGKPHYLAFLPRVWAHLHRDAQHPLLKPLKIWLDSYILPEHRGIINVYKNAQALGLVA